MEDQIAAGHDVGSGGLITTLLEMCFAGYNLDADLDLTGLNEPDIIKALFNENIAVVLQAENDRVFEDKMASNGIRSEEHTSELQSRPHIVCRLLLEKKK